MKLIIVESPHKCATISRFLSSDYKIVASVGHIRDLTSGRWKNDLGIAIKDNFRPIYEISPDKEKIVKSLKEDVKRADEVYLATDPDREGEAISWHLAEVLNLPISTTKRLEFHEITKSAITKAIENPRHIDLNLVNSQEARRIVDRIMGFKLSFLLQSKIKSQSAGRVQSVLLRYVVDREDEIKKFNPVEYWKIFVNLLDNDKNIIHAELETVNGKKPNIKSESEALDIINSLPNSLIVSKVIKSRSCVSPKPPFITSSLQQEAFNKFHFSTKKTQMLAQSLYEGVDINGESTGLITYIRTDSIRLSDEFVSSANDYITRRYDSNYLGTVKVQKESKNIQDAHEAIRPTDLALSPENIAPFLSTDELKLYTLIYKRAVASLMADKINDITKVTFSGNNCDFVAKDVKTFFDGYSKIYNEFIEDETENIVSIPDSIKENDSLKIDNVEKEQHFTQPPARYSEGKLVKLMQEKGIGRPSTYASTISTLIDREYVTKENGALVPSEQGTLTSNKLVEYFPMYMDATYTAKMETSLDNIAEGNEDKVKFLHEFYDNFIKTYEEAFKTMEKIKPTVVEGRVCPLCGKELVYRKSKYGEFIGCSDYPKCMYIEKQNAEIKYVDDHICPDCGGKLVFKSGKKGEFIGCSNYPQCCYMEDLNGSRITYRSTNETRVIQIPKDAEKCPKCHKGFLVEKVNGKTGEKFIACSNFPKCRYIKKDK